jgi:hypothetical protein
LKSGFPGKAAFLCFLWNVAHTLEDGLGDLFVAPVAVVGAATVDEGEVGFAEESGNPFEEAVAVDGNVADVEVLFVAFLDFDEFGDDGGEGIGDRVADVGEVEPGERTVLAGVEVGEELLEAEGDVVGEDGFDFAFGEFGLFVFVQAFEVDEVGEGDGGAEGVDAGDADACLGFGGDAEDGFADKLGVGVAGDVGVVPASGEEDVEEDDGAPTVGDQVKAIVGGVAVAKDFFGLFAEEGDDFGADVAADVEGGVASEGDDLAAAEVLKPGFLPVGGVL